MFYRNMALWFPSIWYLGLPHCMAFLQSRLEGRGKGKLGINRSTPGSPPGALDPRFTISIDAGGGRLGPLLSVAAAAGRMWGWGWGMSMFICEEVAKAG